MGPAEALLQEYIVIEQSEVPRLQCLAREQHRGQEGAEHRHA